MIALPNQNASSILGLLFIMPLRTVPASVESMNGQTKQGGDEFLGEGSTGGHFQWVSVWRGHPVGHGCYQAAVLTPNGVIYYQYNNGHQVLNACGVHAYLTGS